MDIPGEPRTQSEILKIAENLGYINGGAVGNTTDGWSPLLLEYEK